MKTESEPARILRINTLLKYPLPQSWHSLVGPGSFFLQLMWCEDILPGRPLVVYGKVLDISREDVQDRYIVADCYAAQCPEGAEVLARVSQMVALLSQAQFELARRLGWPHWEDGIVAVLGLPRD